MIFRNLLLSAVSAEDMTRLFPRMREVAVRQGETVLEPDQPVCSIYFPSSVVLSVVTVMSDGASVETATIGREGVAGLLAGLTGVTSPSRVFAQIGGSAMRLPARELRQAATDSPALMDLLLRAAQAGAAEAEQSAACNALHDAQGRLARWLLLTQDRVGAATFPLTQDYMAIMVGVQRTTISAIASGLKAKGLIHYTRGAVEVRDRVDLEAAACECYAAVRARYDALDLQRPEAESPDASDS